jgi:aryl-alcohol dehydrogenase-like predicted oxidoreductase
MSMPTFHLAPDLAVSRLCFGTMTMGEQSRLPESLRLLDAAFDAGVNFFDSAEMYPVPQRSETHGRSEEFLGRWLRARRAPRDSVVLATKVAGPSGEMTWIRGGPASLDSRNIAEAIDGSLRRLGVDYIDLYQIHWPDRSVEHGFMPITVIQFRSVAILRFCASLTFNKGCCALVPAAMSRCLERQNMIQAISICLFQWKSSYWLLEEP